jgi:hypothetical protein
MESVFVVFLDRMIAPRSSYSDPRTQILVLRSSYSDHGTQIMVLGLSVATSRSARFTA